MVLTDSGPYDGVVVFSGGSAANNIVDVFNSLVESNATSLSYIIPISDNGGSSSELIRVLGGPGIGDMRSRLVRLIPEYGDPQRHAIKAFFNHRLSSDPQLARTEWLDIVEARHELWEDISSAKKELIRSFLNLLNLEIVKRVRPSSVFSFARASVGNMFLTGTLIENLTTSARLFSGSLESAIYLLSSICGIPAHIAVLPVINTNFSHHIRATLADGTSITGQNSISHPSDLTALASSSNSPTPPSQHQHRLSPFDFSYSTPECTIVPAISPTEAYDAVEDANWPGSLPVLRQQNINFTKDTEHRTLPNPSAIQPRFSNDLLSPITRLYYINPYGQEIRPGPNPRIVSATAAASTIIYSIGSLYTSIIPCLILRGVGAAIRGSALRRDNRMKVLILNGCLDRETSGKEEFTAMDFVSAIAKACWDSMGSLESDRSSGELCRFVTHLIYMDGEGAPKVDKDALAQAGIESVRVYGRRAGNGWRYDEKALGQALGALIGRGGGMEVPSRRRENGRRNTVEM